MHFCHSVSFKCLLTRVTLAEFFVDKRAAVFMLIAHITWVDARFEDTQAINLPLSTAARCRYRFSTGRKDKNNVKYDYHLVLDITIKSLLLVLFNSQQAWFRKTLLLKHDTLQRVMDRQDGLNHFLNVSKSRTLWHCCQRKKPSCCGGF